MRNKQQELNLQVPGCMDVATVVHELMHAIGFIHEHSRPDRDRYVKVDLSNVQEDGKINY